MRLGAGQRRSVDGDLTPRRRDAELRRSPPKLMLQGLIRAAVWPGSFSTARVIHPCPQLGSGRAATVLAAMAAGLHGEARWRAHGSAVLGTGKAANGCAFVREAKATLTRVYAGLSGDAGCSPRQIHGSGTPAAVFRPLQWPTGYGT